MLSSRVRETAFWSVFYVHVIEQNHVYTSVFDDFFQLDQILHFDLSFRHIAIAELPVDGGGDGTGGNDVVVFYHFSVEKTEAVIPPAACADRVFFKIA